MIAGDVEATPSLPEVVFRRAGGLRQKCLSDANLITIGKGPAWSHYRGLISECVRKGLWTAD